MAGHMIQTARDFKEKADELVASGDIYHAMVWYSHIWQLRTSSLLFERLECGMFPLGHFHPDILEAMAIPNSVMLKAAVAEGVLRIKSGLVDPEADGVRMKAIKRTKELNSQLTHPTCCSISDALSLASYHASIVIFLCDRSEEALGTTLQFMGKVMSEGINTEARLTVSSRRHGRSIA
jgi:hypothetical protein